MKSIICKTFSDACAIKHIKYEMKSRHSTNNENHWKIKNKEMHMENTVSLAEFSVYNRYIPSTLMKLVYFKIQCRVNKINIQFYLYIRKRDKLSKNIFTS